MTNDLRSAAPDTSELSLGALTLFPAERCASLGGCDLGLSATEFALLWALVAGHDEHVPVGLLLRAAGWPESTAALSYLDLYISYLRQKLGDDPMRPAALVSVRRSGFMLVSRAFVPAPAPAAPGGLLRAGPASPGVGHARVS